METNKVDILKGPLKEEAAEIYRIGNKKNVCFEIHYGLKRIAFVDILEIVSIEETFVKMLASMPAGFFLYSQGEDSRLDSEKLERIQVHIFYTTNTGKGYIEKVTKGPGKLLKVLRKGERSCYNHDGNIGKSQNHPS